MIAETTFYAKQGILTGGHLVLLTIILTVDACCGWEAEALYHASEKNQPGRSSVGELFKERTFTAVGGPATKTVLRTDRTGGYLHTLLKYIYYYGCPLCPM